MAGKELAVGVMDGKAMTVTDIIPHRAFPEPRAENIAAFVRMGEQMLLAARHGYRSRLSSYLAKHDVFCPKCHYNLRGGAGGAGAGTGPVCGDGSNGRGLSLELSRLV